MKKEKSILVIILIAIVAGCGGRSKQSIDTSGTVDVMANYSEKEPMMQESMDIEEITLKTMDGVFSQDSAQNTIILASNDDIITVNVRRNYSQKKELILQDFMDVEYVVLETNDEFLNQGIVLDVGKEIILVKNRINDGDIFVYNRHGQALRKINHKGQGSEEYILVATITLDEDNGEMFINDPFKRKIIVYDLDGKFKRSFNHKDSPGTLFYTALFIYDKDNLICYDKYNEEIAFVLISKQNGSITKEIKIPFKEKILLQTTFQAGEYSRTVGVTSYPSIIPYNGNWLLLELSSDTVYAFLKDFSLSPYIVRTPSLQSMDPEIMLLLRLISDRYYFMETVRNEYDLNTGTGFLSNYMMYDKQEKTFSGYVVYNGDYATKKEIYMNALTPVNHEIASWKLIESYQLVESYKKGELKDGKLKEIAAKLDEDDNPVIMLVKHKK